MLLHWMLLWGTLLRSTLRVGSRRTLRSGTFRRRDTRRVWRGWRTGGRSWRLFLTRGRRLLGRWFLTRDTCYEQHRHDRKKIQPISPTHQILRACNQQVAASSQQKERLSPHGDRQAPLRRCGWIVAAHPRQRGPKSMSDNSLHCRYFAPRMWRVRPTTGARGTSPGLPAIRTSRGLDAPL